MCWLCLTGGAAAFGCGGSDKQSGEPAGGNGGVMSSGSGNAAGGAAGARTPGAGGADTGVGGSAGSPSQSGGADSSGGSGVGGAPGSGGVVGSGGESGSGGDAGSSGAVGSGGEPGTGGDPGIGGGMVGGGGSDGGALVMDPPGAGIRCGEATCDEESQLCCGDGESLMCDTTSCQALIRLGCDDSVDCPGQRCCFGESLVNARIGTGCGSECDSLMPIQVCKEASDCANGDSCHIYTCGRFETGNVTLGLCTATTPEFCE